MIRKYGSRDRQLHKNWNRDSNRNRNHFSIWLLAASKHKSSLTRRISAMLKNKSSSHKIIYTNSCRINRDCLTINWFINRRKQYVKHDNVFCTMVNITNNHKEYTNESSSDIHLIKTDEKKSIVWNATWKASKQVALSCWQHPVR